MSHLLKGFFEKLAGVQGNTVLGRMRQVASGLHVRDSSGRIAPPKPPKPNTSVGGRAFAPPLPTPKPVPTSYNLNAKLPDKKPAAVQVKQPKQTGRGIPSVSL